MKSIHKLFCLFISFLVFASTEALALDLAYEASSDQFYSRPHDIVLSPDHRFLFVADNGNDRIAVLDPLSLKLIATFAEGEVLEPHDVAFNQASQLLVADTGGNRIAIYEVTGASGKFIGELTGKIRRPEGVVAHPNGRVYATGAGSGNIEMFENGISITDSGGLSAPHDVIVTRDGSLWIADAGNDRLVQMTEDLQIRQTIRGVPYQFNGPRYLDIDDKGRLYVADKYSHQIKVLGKDYGLMFTLGNGRAGMGPGEFDRPEGVAIHGRNIWFSDTYNDRIVRYRIYD